MFCVRGLFFFLSIVFLSLGNLTATAANVSLQQEALTTGDLKTLLFGVSFEVESGRKIQASGDNPAESLGPQIDISGSENISGVKIHFPPAKEFEVGGYRFRAYGESFTLPFEVTVTEPGKPVLLRAKLRYIECGEQCIPEEKSFYIAIPSGTLKLDPDAIGLRYSIVKEHKEQQESTLLWILGMAFLGGLILNLMPCVLPVLALKVMSVVSVKGGKPKKSDMSASILGILTSFWILSGVAIFFKKIGLSMGWGAHFQEPIFLVLMLVMILIFSMNLFDLFHIVLPASVYRVIDRLTPHKQTGWLNSFASGVFATLLATPCSAHFLGVAIGFALAQEQSVIFLVFTAVGLGFSLPYWVFLTIPPRWIPHPKPGPWMNTLKKILGGLLMATALWLSYVLYHQLVIDDRHAPASESHWEPFSENAIQHHLEQGHSVLVMVTAKWCVTCHVNESVLKSSEVFKELVTQKKLVAMKGDWTRRDPKISLFLRKFDRSGIPFMVLFTPKNSAGKVLEELLTHNVLKEELAHVP